MRHLFFSPNVTVKDMSSSLLSDSSVLEVRRQYFVCTANPNFSKLVINVATLSACSTAAYVEYKWDGPSQDIENLSHGNSNHKEPFIPADPTILSCAKDQLFVGVKPRQVYRNLKGKGLRNIQQVNNLAYFMRRKQKEDINRSAFLPNDPWGSLYAAHMKDCKTQSNKFYRFFGSFSSGSNTVIAFSDRQINRLSKFCIKLGSPAHIDTTFIRGAFVTFLCFENEALICKSTGNHPMFIGPLMFHGKEKDSEALRCFLTTVKEALAGHILVFVSDECKMIERRIHEIFPSCCHLLGKEHLIKNFTRNAKNMKVPNNALLELKSDIFGPSVFCNMIPLLGVQREEDWDQTLDNILSKWQKYGREVQHFGEWFKLRKSEIYKKEASNFHVHWRMFLMHGSRHKKELIEILKIYK